MANELNITTRFSYSNGGVTLKSPDNAFDDVKVDVSVSGTPRVLHKVHPLAAGSATWQQLDLDGLTMGEWFWFQNLTTGTVVDLGVYDSGAGAYWPCATLNFGDPPIAIRTMATAVYAARSNAALSYVEIRGIGS